MIQDRDIPTAAFWIDRLDLKEHPEGGYFRESYRSAETIPGASLPDRYLRDRCFGTAIYFLLPGDQFSALHRLKSDEVWHFYVGSSLTLHLISADGTYVTRGLGPDPDRGAGFQAVVPAHTWFGVTVDDPVSYSLVGCTVAPGFDFADFELGEREQLLARYPRHDQLIRRLTRV